MIAFGPIPSRRLGKSLGINNIASHKVCSYSCVYCQIGNTKNKSIVRQNFYEPVKLVEDVEKHLKKLDKDNTPDYLTFVANGEPTLDINLGKEIKLLRMFGIPIAVITNSSLIYDKYVQDDLMEADWVSVKIDTINETVWNKINRPLAGINYEKIIEGLQSFTSNYKGKLNTETMLVEGFNDLTGNAFDDILNITAVHPLREDTITKLLEQNKTSLSVINSLVAQELIKSINYKEKKYYIRNYHC